MKAKTKVGQIGLLRKGFKTQAGDEFRLGQLVKVEEGYKPRTYYFHASALPTGYPLRDNVRDGRVWASRAPSHLVLIGQEKEGEGRTPE